MYLPKLSEFKQLSRKANIIPVSKEMFFDTRTPIGIFMKFAKEKNSFLLESIEGGEKWARYSFIGRNPYMTFESAGETITIVKDGVKTQVQGNPIEKLKEIFADLKGIHIDGLPRFSGGAVGYLGYDMVRHIEDIPDAPPDDVGAADCYLMFCREIIAYDHLKQRVIVIVNAEVEGDAEAKYERATQRIAQICGEILEVDAQQNAAQEDVYIGDVTSNFSKEAFCSAVDKVKQYIKNGDTFQTVISQRFAIKTNVNPLSVYRVLRTINPSPYMYYLNLMDKTIVGASPELLVRVEDSVVETCPIAGTRPRGKTEQEDIALEKELLVDEKERAEHTMLVDLGRNDIGKVSKFGSVEVLDMMHIERYSHVMHIVTNVKGELKDDKGAFDALGAVLPAGTLSGAPKVRAMEIINELEPVKRGIYGGCIGYIGFDGNIDTCITIRTVVFDKDTAFIQAGGGIVADSVPEKEYEESYNKASAVIKAIEKAGELS